MKRSMNSMKKIAASILATLSLVNVFAAAASDSSVAITVSNDGKEKVYETYADTVGEFLTSVGISVKDNDILSHDKDAEIEPGMTIAIDVAKYITVHDDGKTYAAISYKDTVKDVLKDFSRPISAADASEPGKTERVYDGSVITVSRAKYVSFSRGGSTVGYYTHSETVNDFLNEIGVNLADNQIVNPSESSKIRSGLRIQVIDKNARNKVQAIETVKVPVEVAVEEPVVEAPVAEATEANSNRTSVPSLPLIAPGQIGSGWNGSVMSALNFNADLSKARVLTCEATAYTAAPDECGPWADGRTATGAICQVGVVAVDPKVIPMKSKLYIVSADGSFIYGYCTAEDTGGAIKGNKVDLAMNTKKECFQFGRRKIKVYIIEE